MRTKYNAPAWPSKAAPRNNRQRTRHERRRARAMRGHNAFYTDYVAHLPRIPLDAPLEPGRVYH